MLGTWYPVYQEQFQETDKCDRLSVFVKNKKEIHFLVRNLTGLSMYCIINNCMLCQYKNPYNL